MWWKSSRDKDREMFKEIIKEVTRSNERQLEVVAEQTQLVARMIGFFETGSAPRARVVDDEREIEIQRLRRGA
jgi:hypothetical protein